MGDGRRRGLAARWRSGGRRPKAGRPRRAREGEPDLSVLDGDEVRIRTPSHDTALVLVEIIRGHGVECDVRRPRGAEVAAACPAEARADAVQAVVQGVRLWLHRDDTPDAVELRRSRRKRILLERTEQPPHGGDAELAGAPR